MKTANKTQVVMKNNNAIDLEQNAVVDLAEGIQFKVADKSNTLRFYPRKIIKLKAINNAETENLIITAKPTPETTSEKPYETSAKAGSSGKATEQKSTPAKETKTESTERSTQTKTLQTPGFSALLTGLVMLGLATLHKKQNK